MALVPSRREHGYVRRSAGLLLLILAGCPASAEQRAPPRPETNPRAGTPGAPAPLEARLIRSGARVVLSRAGRARAALQVRPLPLGDAAPGGVLGAKESWQDEPLIAAGGLATRLLTLPAVAAANDAAPKPQPLSVLVRAERTGAGVRILVSPEAPARDAGAQTGTYPRLELAIELFADADGREPALTAIDAPPGVLALPDAPGPDGKPFRATRISFAAKDRPRIELARSAPASWTLHKLPGALLLRQALRADPRDPGRPGSFMLYCGEEWDGGPAEVSPLWLTKRETPTWDFMEGALRAYAAGADPYAYDELAVMAEIAFPEDAAAPAPGGQEAKVLRLPCYFWEGTQATPAEGEFRFRFAPPAPGTYGVRPCVVTQGKVVRGEAVAVRAGAPASRGFVRARNGERVLRCDDDSVFLPVGLNLAWPNRKGDAEEYRRRFIRLARYGGTAARVWLSSWGLPLEKSAGVFDADIAAALDEVFLAAQARDIHLLLVMENAFDVTTNFARHPYSRDRGGPLPAPAEFFRDQASARLFKRRLTYAAARYGAFRSLLAWELINEADEAWPAAKPDPDDPRTPPAEADHARAARRGIIAWSTQMAAHLQGMDGHAHPVALSLAFPPDEPWLELEKAPGLAFVQYHGYVPEAADARENRMLDEAALLAGWAEAARGVGRAHRPFWLGEFGYRALNADDFAKASAAARAADRTIRDGEGLLLHNSLLAGLAAGQAGTPLGWWWDRYVEGNGLWPLFRGAALFAEALAGLAAAEGPENLRAISNDGERLAVVRVLGRAGRKGMCVWVQDKRSSWSARLERGEAPAEISDLELRLPALEPGRYTVRWLDTWRGAELARAPLTVAPLQRREEPRPLELKAPRFRADVALAIEPDEAGK